MTEIKLFEEYNTYYTQLSYDEWSELKIQRDHFTESELSILKSLPKSVFLSKVSIGSITLKFEVGCRLFIYKGVDEWFFVANETNYSIKNTYYKCDQFEGLIKLIKDLDYKIN